MILLKYVKRLLCLVLVLGFSMAQAGLNNPPLLVADANGVGSMSAVAKARADNPGSVQVLKTFDQQHEDTADANSAIPLKQKHRILFYLGGALLLFVLATGFLGIAVGIFERPWFLWHMVTAGLTMTLAVVHAIVAMVWFFPF